VTVAIREAIKLSNYIEAKTDFEMATKWIALEVTSNALFRLTLALYQTIFPAAIAHDGMGSSIVAVIGHKISQLEIELNINGEIISDAMFLSQWAELQKFHYCSNTNTAVISGEASLKLAEKDGVRQRQLLLLAQMVQVYTCAGDHQKSIQVGTRALSLYRWEEDSEMSNEFGWDPKCVTLSQLSQLSHSYAILGDLSKAYALGEQSYRHAKKLDSEVNIEIALVFEVLIGYLDADKDFIVQKSAM
jgi:hypothetical protein